MTIKKVNDREQWEKFITKNAPISGAFLNMWGRGDSIGFFDGDELVGIASLSKKKLPFNLAYILIERGPILKTGVLEADALRLLSLEFCNVAFIRFEPLSNIPPLVNKTIHVSPEETLVLNLSKTEERLLSEMHPKTRYNIRLAERKGVSVRELGVDEFDLAWKIFQETSSRDAFRLHSKTHYKKWLDRGARLVGAFYDGNLIAVNMMFDYAGTRTYLHGASSSSHREVMAPHALQWHEIVGAKKLGLVRYDFWGISENNPAWAGITRFKLGFGGERFCYPGTFDLVLDRKKYAFYMLARKLWRLISDLKKT
jgi:lipid II:glycine glycyltransferase (peptidoglycan interpeptide bridge formation enzyme)